MLIKIIYPINEIAVIGIWYIYKADLKPIFFFSKYPVRFWDLFPRYVFYFDFFYVLEMLMESFRFNKEFSTFHLQLISLSGLNMENWIIKECFFNRKYSSKRNIFCVLHFIVFNRFFFSSLLSSWTITPIH